MNEEFKRLLREKREHKIFYLHSDICLSTGKDDIYNFQYNCLESLPEHLIDILIAFVLSKSGAKGFYFNLAQQIVFL
jgi:hypothetical protein